MISPEAQAIAERHAAEDRDILARLVKEGHVRRDGPANALTRDIDRRVAALAPGMDTIRPKRKKGKRR